MKGHSQTAELFTSNSTKPAILWGRVGAELLRLVIQLQSSHIQARGLLVCCQPTLPMPAAPCQHPPIAVAVSISALLFSPVTPRTSLMSPPQQDKQNRQCSLSFWNLSLIPVLETPKCLYLYPALGWRTEGKGIWSFKIWDEVRFQKGHYLFYPAESKEGKKASKWNRQLLLVRPARQGSWQWGVGAADPGTRGETVEHGRWPASGILPTL